MDECMGHESNPTYYGSTTELFSDHWVIFKSHNILFILLGHNDHVFKGTGSCCNTLVRMFWADKKQKQGSENVLCVAYNLSTVHDNLMNKSDW